MTRYRVILYPALILLTAALFAQQWWKPSSSAADRIDTWLGRVNDPDARVRTQAALKLGEQGRDSDDAWRALARMTLHEQDADVRETAIQSLKTLSQSNTPRDDPQRMNRKRAALRVLLDGLRNSDPAARARAPAALFEAGGLRFYGRAIRRSLDDAVDEATRPEIVQALVAALHDDEEEVCDEAARYLKQCGPAIVPVLRGALQTEPEKARRYLHDCLKALGADKNS